LTVRNDNSVLCSCGRPRPGRKRHKARNTNRACWRRWGIAGTLDQNDYRGKLAAAGFEQIAIEPTGIYRAEDAPDFLSGQQIPVNLDPAQIDGKFFSGFSPAMKPAGSRSLAAVRPAATGRGRASRLCLC